MNSEIEKYLLEAKYKSGWFAKPHFLVHLVKDKYISKNAYIVLDLLLHVENVHHRRNANKWFFCSRKRFAETGIISEGNAKEGRIELENKHIIACRAGRKKSSLESRSGYKRNAMEFKILIPGKYYIENK